jgi:hypothetical protein
LPLRPIAFSSGEGGGGGVTSFLLQSHADTSNRNASGIKASFFITGFLMMKWLLKSAPKILYPAVDFKVDFTIYYTVFSPVIRVLKEELV